MYLVILTLYIPPLYIVQRERLTEWGRGYRAKPTGQGGELLQGEEDNVMWQWKMGSREMERGVKLSCRCYQVKPPTAGCRYGDTMVTTRCSTRKEQDLACVKGLPLCVCSSLFLSLSVCQVLLISKVYAYKNSFIFSNKLKSIKFI